MVCRAFLVRQAFLVIRSGAKQLHYMLGGIRMEGIPATV